MTADLTDVLAAALRRRVSGTDDEIRRLAESLIADGPLADHLEQAAADTRRPFLDLADRIAEQAAPLRSTPEATARWHGLALSEIATRIRDAAGDPGDRA